MRYLPVLGLHRALFVLFCVHIGHVHVADCSSNSSLFGTLCCHHRIVGRALSMIDAGFSIAFFQVFVFGFSQ